MNDAAAWITNNYLIQGRREIDPSTVRDISADVLDEQGNLRIMPASYWATTTTIERSLFGNRQGAYGLPTTELIDHLRRIIDGRHAIEIGAGNGILAAALGITATDSYQQADPHYRQVYVAAGHTPIRYGPNVLMFDAHDAVARYTPQVVVASWVTHRWDPRRHAAGGNEVGVDEDRIIDSCDTYVMVGNEEVHKDKAIWARPHHIEYPPYVYSRAMNGSRDFIAVWNRT